MSDESQGTSVSEALPSIGDAVENAVSDNQIPNDNLEAAAPQEAVEQLAKLAAKPNLTKQEAKTLKKLKIKFDQKEYDEELPFEIPNTPQAIEYMQRQLQMSRLATTRSQEKATIEKEVMRFITDLKNDPMKALSDPAIGMDIKKFAASVIEKEIEDSKKSPVQLEKEKLEAELRQIKADAEKEKNEARDREMARMTEQEAERYDTLMTQAFEKHSMPKNPAVVRRMAEYLIEGTKAGKDVTPEDIVPLIREDLKNDYRDILSSMPEDDLEDFIGKDVLNRLRKKNVAKAKAANSNPAVKGTKPANVGKKGEAKVEEKKISFKDFFKGI